MTTKSTDPDKVRGPLPGEIPAAEYARLIDVQKSRMSAYFGKGLPYRDGCDAHGRTCKFVVPDDADAWRAATLQTKVQDGRVRGIVEPRTPSPRPEPEQAAPQGEAEAANASVEPKAPERPVSAPAPGSPAVSTAERIQAARAEQAEVDLDTRRLNRDRTAGTLVDRKAAIAAHRGFVGKMASQLDRMPADQATLVAAELGLSEHAVYMALQKVATKLRSDLEQSARAEADRWSGRPA